MDTMNWTAQEAMDALKIEEEERPRYIELLENSKQNQSNRKRPLRETEST